MSLMEAPVALEREELHKEGEQQVPCSSSLHRELLVWRTLPKVLGLSQVVLILTMIVLLRLCSQYSQQAGQRHLTPDYTVWSSSGTSAEGMTPEETASSKPRLCPLNWLSHKGKCYYFSKDSGNWSRSREDCAERGSRLLVLQDQEERDFIQNKTQNRFYWIGLHIPAPGSNWIWVDGSSFINGTLFSVSSSKEGGKCVAVIKGSYDSDSCGNYANWICQKEAGEGETGPSAACDC